MAKHPWFPFYPADWLSDEKLRACSLAARALWLDMLCLMHKADRRGFLQLSGKPVTAEQLARMTGCSTDEVSQALAELRHAGVFSVSEHGIIYSRRMVRDEQIRQTRREVGQKGGRPPGSAERRTKPAPENQTESKPKPNPKPNENPQSHRSESESEKDKDPPVVPPSGDHTHKADLGLFGPIEKPHAPPTAKEFEAAWNNAAALGGWHRCQNIGKTRERAFQARCKDAFWCQHWRDALTKALGIPWLRGQGKGQWFMTLDWFLRENSVTRILEEAAQQPARPVASGGSLLDKVRAERERKCSPLKPMTNGSTDIPASSA